MSSFALNKKLLTSVLGVLPFLTFGVKQLKLIICGQTTGKTGKQEKTTGKTGIKF